MLGIDIAKSVFQLHGIDKAGKAELKKRLTRKELLPYIAKLTPCTLVMKACSGANYWYRQFKTLDHEVKLISPQFVKPFVKTNKNDANDAQAICEAARRYSQTQGVKGAEINDRAGSAAGVLTLSSKLLGTNAYFNTPLRKIQKKKALKV